MLKEHENIIIRLRENEVQDTLIYALYGTGEGADIIYDAFSEMKLAHCIQYVIDRDDSDLLGTEYRGIKIQKLSEVYEKVDCIIIAAKIYYQVVTRRVKAFLDSKKSDKKIINIYAYNSRKEKEEYVEYIEKSVLKVSEDFVDFSKTEYRRDTCDSKIIAWYLPQFHQMEINNKFHGQGFTEWTNSSRAIPLFVGHYQPHIPYDVGYYDLTNLDSFKRQIYLAKHYGIFGFCFHYYWFSRKRIMETPIELFLKHKELDMPFCLNWATENWTALWDGGNKEIMYEQKLNEGDDKLFFQDILPYFKDERYIKIDGRPILSIYRCDMFEKEEFAAFLNRLRQYAKSEGFPDLFVLLTTAGRFDGNEKAWGVDAIVEFPPWKISLGLKNIRPNGYLNPYFEGRIMDAKPLIDNKGYMMHHASQCYFRSALTSFDNTARKCTTGAQMYLGLNPDTYKVWLKDILRESKRIHDKSHDFVFVNSWNEWAEGSHLEPDMKYGYAYLQATKEALEEVRSIV